MSLQRVDLEFVTISNIAGKPISFPAGMDSADEPSGFRARFGLTVDADTLNEPENLRFTVSMKFEAIPPKETTPFFTIEIVGHFKLKNEEEMDSWINSEEGAYSLGATLFPYLRNLSKPILEGLGAAQVDFPWSSPEISKIHGEPPKKKKSPKKTSIS